jgi:hypothetical protein
MMELDHQARLSKVTSLIGAMRNHADVKYGVGLLDISASLEVLICEMYSIREGLKLKKLELIKPNFPAIDLADDEKSIAIQVTSDASAQKRNETIRIFKKKGLDAKYTDLRIVGFCRATKPKNPIHGVEVLGPNDVLSGIKAISNTQLESLESNLMNSINFSSLHPLRDEDCLQTVMHVLDRDAVRHQVHAEGSFSDFVVGIKEIKELINTGKIKGKSIFAKPLSTYSSEYNDFLTQIDLHLSKMLATVNKSKSGESYYLNEKSSQEVDHERDQLITLANDFCKSHNIKRNIVAIG